jgi:hypothetical protein
MANAGSGFADMVDNSGVKITPLLRKGVISRSGVQFWRETGSWDAW